MALLLRVILDRGHRRAWSKYFDREWYERANPDVFRSRLQPALHYALQGHLEGRSASAGFDSAFYLRRHPDVQRAGINPLLHFVIFGSEERRTTAPAVVTASSPYTAGERSARTSPPASSIVRLAPARAGHPLVSVVIPCFNYGQFLEEAIASVQAQTFRNWELIVVEGGSTDGETPEFVRELENRHLPGTRFFYRAEPCLAGDNRNFGISEARGRYICCLDADDRIQPTYLEVAVFLAETYGYDVVYPSVQFFGNSEAAWVLDDASFPEIAEENQISTVALFRREAWREAGGYRDWGKGDSHVAEDWEFWVRVMGYGYRAKSIRQRMMMYRVHERGLWHSAAHQVERQRQAIRSANATLISEGGRRRPAAAPDGWGSLAEPDDRPGLLLALPFVTIGGAERIFEAITVDAIARGYRPVVITTLTLPESVTDARSHFESITPYVYALPEILAEQEPGWPAFLAYLLVRYNIKTLMIAGCDYVYHLLPAIRSAFPEVRIVDQLFNDQVHFPTNRHYAAYIDQTIVPSNAFARRLYEEFSEAPDRVAVIPHGVAIPANSAPGDFEACWKRSGLPPSFHGCFLVGFFGRLSLEKAPADFIEMVRILAGVSGFKFVMTGDGPEQARIRELIRRYGIEEKIYTPGFVENHDVLMMLMDLVVVPSHLDGMPLVVMEAQALGKPVVASSVGSIPDMIRDQETGFLCEPGDIDGFVEKIMTLYQEPELRKRIGCAARLSVQQNHSEELMTQRYFDAFQAQSRTHAEPMAAPALMANGQERHSDSDSNPLG